ncbi:hypothetical protein ACFL34_04550 [Candidatus Sumerlaeota bacterium]
MEKLWLFEEGDGPIVAAAIHDGHTVREEVENLHALSEDQRLREEDPYTGVWTEVADRSISRLGLTRIER